MLVSVTLGGIWGFALHKKECAVINLGLSEHLPADFWQVLQYCLAIQQTLKL